ncbi:hypothetical protein A1O3_07180 [Capronia epimyces CBS 606.96]|uniref:Protein alcS n=1 Tax=Capronia epimyces CBS 606.96 TaxID=1182542 RepID=W9XK72_9EURO|nr:uncharacterized protein A1O3_07180 [Capronia epimyces CBS 606.96]EXJ80892.1 hypothetical protein A1O3_07180 [Capronia epimyces CBS 606.96]
MADNYDIEGQAQQIPPKEADNFDAESHARLVSDSPAQVRITLRPIAPPAALGLAGFAGSTLIVSTWVCRWWGNPDSPLLFFPFIGLWGGLAQFIAGLYGFAARDVLVTVVNTMWGSFWMALGILYAFVAAGSIEGHSIYTHYPEFAVWFIPLTMTTWVCAIAATARDVVLSLTLFTLSIGCTIALTLFAHDEAATRAGIKVAAYFWMMSAFLAWWRSSVFIIE